MLITSELQAFSASSEITFCSAWKFSIPPYIDASSATASSNLLFKISFHSDVRGASTAWWYN